MTPEMREALALAKTLSVRAIQRLGELMEEDGRNAAVAKAACDSILDRALGKPTQAVTIDAEGSPAELPRHERVAMLRRVLEREEAELAAEPKSNGTH